MYMESPSTHLLSLFPPRLVLIPTIRTHINSTTRMSSNTSQIPPCLYTDQSLSCTLILPSPPLASSMPLRLKLGSTSFTLKPKNRPPHTGSPSLEFSTSSFSRVPHLTPSSGNMRDSPAPQHYPHIGPLATISVVGTISARMMFAAYRNDLMRKTFPWMLFG